MFDTSILNNLVVLATYDLFEDENKFYWIIIITPLIFLFIIHKIFKDKTDKNYETIKKFGYLFFKKKF